jgi:hypothetical protein
MTGALAVVGPRVGQLIRMLGSDRDGEVLSAVRALGRTLRSVDRDFHDLAAVIERETAAPRGSDHRLMAVWLLKSGSLSAKEQLFVRQMSAWRSEPSEKQAAWLLSIFERVSAGGVP